MNKIDEEFKIVTKAMSESADFYKKSEVGKVVEELFTKFLNITNTDYPDTINILKISSIMKQAKENYQGLLITIEKLTKTIDSNKNNFSQEDRDSLTLLKNYVNSVIDNKDAWLNIIPERSDSMGRLAKKWVKENFSETPRESIIEKLESIKKTLEAIPKYSPESPRTTPSE